MFYLKTNTNIEKTFPCIIIFNYIILCFKTKINTIKKPIVLNCAKKYLFCLILLSLIFCKISSSSAQGRNDTLKAIPKINKKFLVAAHIVLDKNGNGTYSPDAIRFALASVTEIFKPINASFELCEVDSIPNFKFMIINDGIGDVNELRAQYNRPGRLNIYFSDSLVVNGKGGYCGLASLGGIASGSKPSVVLVCSDAVTIAHELGHYFGLEHTFNQNGRELANGSNCATAGDFVCDTPADPYNSSMKMELFMPRGCKFIWQGKDANGQYYNPDPSNVMSYYPCSSLIFTRGQYERMAKTYLANPIAW